MHLMYALIDGKPVPVDDTIQWAQWMESARRSGLTDIGKDTVNGVYVSTVFLGVDHGFIPWDGPEPVLFETMVFPKNYDPKDSSTYAGKRMYRYRTLEEAEAGHKEIVAALKDVHVTAGAEARAVLDMVRNKVFGGGE